MARPDWGAIQEQFLADHAKSNISPKDWCEAQGLNYSTAKRYIKIANANSESANRSANSQKGKDTKSRQAKESGRNRESGKDTNSPDAKPERPKRNVVTNHPPFQPGNQHALKHGGYGRRMLLSDAVTEDALALTLDDELFWLRAANLTAAENIGRWNTELESSEGEEAKYIHGLISSAEKAMHRNTARIESLEFTKAAINKANSQDDKLRYETLRGKALQESELRKITAEADRAEKEAAAIKSPGNPGEQPMIVINLVNSPDAE
ncbi:hypothetical protein AB8991_20870 [Yersinia enterocolitica]|uniref:hypothetical protein n=1 Tax=Yersinia enterocolitica TaxID=630 RepID=UPI003D0165E3